MTVAGRGKDLLLVIGDAVDAGKLTRKLKEEEVGEAEILELRTLPGGTHDASSKDTVVTLSPYQRHPTPSPGYYQHYATSPMAAQGGYGYGYGHGHGYAGGAAACTRARWRAATR